MKRLQVIKENLESIQLEYDTQGYVSTNDADELIKYSNELIQTIEQYQLQKTLLLERLKKHSVQIKEMKHNSRLTRFYDMAEENLKLAEENARLKEMIPV